jgi:hypothetical protein
MHIWLNFTCTLLAIFYNKMGALAARTKSSISAFVAASFNVSRSSTVR